MDQGRRLTRHPNIVRLELTELKQFSSGTQGAACACCWQGCDGLLNVKKQGIEKLAEATMSHSTSSL